MKNIDYNQSIENPIFDNAPIAIENFGADKTEFEKKRLSKEQFLESKKAARERLYKIVQNAIDAAVERLLPEFDLKRIEQLKNLFPHANNLIEVDWQKKLELEQEEVVKAAALIAANRKVNFKSENFAAVKRPFLEAQARLQQLIAKKDVLEFYSVQASSVDVSRYQDLKQRQFGTKNYSSKNFVWQIWQDKLTVRQLIKKYSVNNFANLDAILASHEENLSQLETQIDYWQKEFNYWNELDILRQKHEAVVENALGQIRAQLREALWDINEPPDFQFEDWAGFFINFLQDKRELKIKENEIRTLETELNKDVEKDFNLISETQAFQPPDLENAELENINHLHHDSDERSQKKSSVIAESEGIGNYS